MCVAILIFFFITRLSEKRVLGAGGGWEWGGADYCLLQGSAVTLTSNPQKYQQISAYPKTIPANYTIPQKNIRTLAQPKISTTLSVLNCL